MASQADRSDAESLARESDREAIRQLKARYCRFIDTKEWAAFHELFTEDCRHFLPQESHVTWMNNDEYFAMIERPCSASE